MYLSKVIFLPLFLLRPTLHINSRTGGITMSKLVKMASAERWNQGLDKGDVRLWEDDRMIFLGVLSDAKMLVLWQPPFSLTFQTL